MSTVIIGGGIIGSSIAYYLSGSQSDKEIHIIESSSKLFSSASGYAAGFLAKDWFSPSLAPLGALSFDLHNQLAIENEGEERWGFMKGTAFNLDETDAVHVQKGGASGDDWMLDGTSRAETAAGSSETTRSEPPSWMTKQDGLAMEKISEGETVAQVDPLRLSTYLMDVSVSRGVKLHHPAKAVSLVTDEATGTITGVKVMDLNSQTESAIACTNLVVCTGAWTPRTFQELFPSSQTSIPISPLAGYSLVIRSPRYTLEHENKTYGGRSHAVFTEHPTSCGFSPELFSRRGGEIYIAGLNSSDIPLPASAHETSKLVEQSELEKLKSVAVRLMGRLADGSSESSEETPNTDDLEILREGLCFRPVTSRGTPIVSRVADDLLGNNLRTGPVDETGNTRSRGGIFVAAGHGPWGISLSLGTGKIMAELIQGIETSADVRGLRL